jgi:hypothetical protein
MNIEHNPQPLPAVFSVPPVSSSDYFLVDRLRPAGCPNPGELEISPRANWGGPIGSAALGGRLFSISSAALTAVGLDAGVAGMVIAIRTSDVQGGRGCRIQNALLPRLLIVPSFGPIFGDFITPAITRNCWSCDLCRWNKGF